jgi:hypothetical protein
MKKFLLWCITIIQILLFAGIFVLERLSHKYMTIMRYVLYRNRIWETEVSTYILLYVGKVFLIAIALISVISLIAKVIRDRKLNLCRNRQLAALAVISAGSAFFIKLSSVDVMQTYFFSVILLFIITVIQFIKAILEN